MPGSNLDCLVVREGLESEPWMSLEWLLAPVPVVIEKLLPGIDGLLSHEDEPGHLLDHHDLGDAVGAHAAVVQQPTIAARLLGPINAGNVSLDKRHGVRWSNELTNTVFLYVWSNTCNNPCWRPLSTLIRDPLQCRCLSIPPRIPQQSPPCWKSSQPRRNDVIRTWNMSS